MKKLFILSILVISTYSIFSEEVSEQQTSERTLEQTTKKQARQEKKQARQEKKQIDDYYTQHNYGTYERLMAELAGSGT